MVLKQLAQSVSVFVVVGQPKITPIFCFVSYGQVRATKGKPPGEEKKESDLAGQPRAQKNAFWTLFPLCGEKAVRPKKPPVALWGKGDGTPRRGRGLGKGAGGRHWRGLASG